jgi:hypothetical protein
LEEKGSLYGKELFLHPVVETYTYLRSFKFNRIYKTNYFAFMFLFLIPFFPLMLFNHKYKGSVDYWKHFGWEKLHYVSILYLLTREIFQFTVEKEKMKYFVKRSNWLELSLIVTSIVLSVHSSVSYNSLTIVILEIAFILMTTISATTLNFLTKDPVYVKILKKITKIFLKIMHVFIVIICGLAFCIYIVLEDDPADNDPKNSTQVTEEVDDMDAYIKSPVSSFLKVLTMLSGEFSFELDKYTNFQLIFCLLFVITSFILFNLIVGISFENIENIMNESRQMNVLDKIRKLNEMEETFGVVEKW